MCRQQNQVEPVVDLINAIFHGDARHRLSLRYLGLDLMIIGLVIGVGSFPQGQFVIWRDCSALLTPARGRRAAGASESTLRMFLDKKTLHCVVINIPFLIRAAVGSERTDRQGLAVRGNARSAAAAPRNLSYQPSPRET